MVRHDLWRVTYSDDGIVEWLKDLLSYWMTCWVIEWLVDWLKDLLINWRTCWVIEGLIEWLKDMLSYWRTCWLIEGRVDWLKDLLIDWLLAGAGPAAADAAWAALRRGAEWLPRQAAPSEELQPEARQLQLLLHQKCRWGTVARSRRGISANTVKQDFSLLIKSQNAAIMLN